VKGAGSAGLFRYTHSDKWGFSMAVVNPAGSGLRARLRFRFKLRNYEVLPGFPGQTVEVLDYDGPANELGPEGTYQFTLEVRQAPVDRRTGGRRFGIPMTWLCIQRSCRENGSQRSCAHR
jgi:hypothetical protein